LRIEMWSNDTLRGLNRTDLCAIEQLWIG
jgi:hypothetical protein